MGRFGFALTRRSAVCRVWQAPDYLKADTCQRKYAGSSPKIQVPPLVTNLTQLTNDFSPQANPDPVNLYQHVMSISVNLTQAHPPSVVGAADSGSQ